ncbi:MAG: Uma2 family endonuclease [Ardenticatenales bacterium]
MALPQTVTLVSADEYLAQEVLADDKHEYVDGVVVSMSGGSIKHSRIKTDLARIVGSQLAGGQCEVFDSDLRVRVDANFYTYPDVTVVCGEAVLAPDGFDNLVNPTAIFEVLSASTEARDRGEKWIRYRQIPSLQHYVLVSQSQPQIEVFTRSGDVWTFTDASGLDASLHLETIGVALALDEVYGRVTFEEDESTGLVGEPRG